MRKIRILVLMDATFVEMPTFQLYRPNYLDDEEYRALQNVLMLDPTAGDEIEGTGGLCKLRFRYRAKNIRARGGLRIFISGSGGNTFFGCLPSTVKERRAI